MKGGLQQELGTSASSQFADDLLCKIQKYYEEIKSMKKEIKNLENERSMAIMHLCKYRDDYSLLRHAYKMALDWLKQNSSLSDDFLFDGRGNQNIMENEPKQQIDKENTEVYNEYRNVIDNKSETGKEMKQMKKQRMSEVEIKDNTSDFTYQIDMESKIFKNKNGSDVNLLFALQGEFPITAMALNSDGDVAAFSDNYYLYLISTKQRNNRKNKKDRKRGKNKNSKKSDDDEYVENNEHLNFQVLHQIKLKTIDGENGPSRAVAFSIDGKYCALGANGNYLYVYNVSDGSLLFQPQKSHENDISRILFTSDEKYLITAGFDGSIQIYTIDPFDNHKLLKPNIDVSSNSSPPIITGMVEDTNSESIIISYVKGTLLILNMKDFAVKTMFQTDINMLMGISLSISNNILATYSNKSVKLWRLTDKLQFCGELEGHSDYVLSLAFSNKFPICISSSKDENIMIWKYNSDPKELNDNQMLFKICGQKNTIFSVCHDPSSNKFLSCSADGSVCCWEYILPDEIEPFKETEYSSE